MKCRKQLLNKCLSRVRLWRFLYNKKVTDYLQGCRLDNVHVYLLRCTSVIILKGGGWFHR